MAARPCFVTERNWWGCEAARMASTAIWTFPSVPFLKPTGMERPEASSRWTWLSVVRAPQEPRHLLAALRDRGGGALGDRVLLHEDGGGNQGTEAVDAEVVGEAVHGGSSRA